VFGSEISFWVYVLNTLVLILSLFLILLVLIQRGKGGGLAGAFGGVGGSSAFGSRAGDMFTKITIGVAAAWIILTMISVVVIQRSDAATRSVTPEISSE
jgi:preprotein translocase subunit SecG